MPEDILILFAIVLAGFSALVWIFFNVAVIKRLDRIATLLENISKK